MANLDFSAEFVDEIRINMESRTFEIYGSDGSCQQVTCDDTDQFMADLKRLSNIESEIYELHRH